MKQIKNGMRGSNMANISNMDYYEEGYKAESLAADIETKSILGSQNIDDNRLKLRSLCREHLGGKFFEITESAEDIIRLMADSLMLSGEVITSPLLAYDLVEGMIKVGLKPVFCDIRLVDYTLDTQKLRTLITPKTTAILAPHSFGYVCQIEEIDEIARENGLQVIYDASDAFCEQYKGQNMLDFGTFSIMRNPHLDGFEQSNEFILAYTDSELVTLVSSARSFDYGKRLNSLQIAMNISQIVKVKQLETKKAMVVDMYKDRLIGMNGVRVLRCQDDVRSNNEFLPMVISEKVFLGGRDSLISALTRFGIPTRIKTLASDRDYEGVVFDSRRTPAAQIIMDRLIQLPVQANMTQADVDKIVNIIRAYQIACDIEVESKGQIFRVS